MVRKQIYIEAHQQTLKRLARQTGKTEAEIIRDALDEHVRLLKAKENRMAAWREIEAIARRSRATSLQVTLSVPGRETIFTIARSVRVLIDTNVLVYLYDESNPRNSVQARLDIRGPSRCRSWRREHASTVRVLSCSSYARLASADAARSWYWPS